MAEERRTERQQSQGPVAPRARGTTFGPRAPERRAALEPPRPTVPVATLRRTAELIVERSVRRGRRARTARLQHGDAQDSPVQSHLLGGAMQPSAVSSDFLCDVQPDPDRDRVFVRVAGELDVNAVPQVAATVDDLLDAGFGRVVIDLRGLSF